MYTVNKVYKCLQVDFNSPLVKNIDNLKEYW